MDYSREQLKNMYQALPQDIKEALYEINTAQAIQTVSNSFGLHIDQMGELAHAIGLVMLGALHPKDFSGYLQRNVGVNESTALAMTKEVNATVFNTIRASLKKIHKMREDGEYESALGGIPNRESILRDIEMPPKAAPTPAREVQTVKEPEVPQAPHLSPQKSEQVTPQFQSVETLLRIPRKESPSRTTPDPYREPLE